MLHSLILSASVFSEVTADFVEKTDSTLQWLVLSNVEFTAEHLLIFLSNISDLTHLHILDQSECVSPSSWPQPHIFFPTVRSLAVEEYIAEHSSARGRSVVRVACTIDKLQSSIGGHFKELVSDIKVGGELRGIGRLILEGWLP